MDRSVTIAAGLVVLAIVGGIAYFTLAVPDNSEGAPALLSGGEQSQAGEVSFEGSSGEEETVALTSETDIDAFGGVEDAVGGIENDVTAAAEEKGTVVTLTGRAVDEGGRPVADALVTFSEGGMRSFRGMWSGREEEDNAPTTYTDKDGVFLLEAELEPRRGEEGLPSFLSASDRVVLSHTAFATMTRLLGSTAQRESEHDLGTFVMADGATVSGRAVDELGRPLKDAVVSAENEDPNERGSWFRSFRPGLEQFLQARTESDGRFMISGLSAGEAAVTARRDDRALGVVEDLLLVAGVVNDVGDVVLQPGAFIEGRVMDEQGRPVVGASIRVSSMARVAATHQDGVGQSDRRSLGHEWRLRAETDDRGTFRIAGMSEGIYNVHAEAEGYAEVRKENVSTGSRNVTLKVEGLGEVLLVVTNGLNGERVDGVHVVPERSPWDRGDEDGPRFLVGSAIPEAVLADMAGMSEDLAGLVLVQGVSRDGMEASLLADGFARSAASLPGVGPGKVVRFDAALVPESVVRGRVVDGAGEPVEGARVRFNEQMVQTLIEEDDGRRGGRSGRSNRNVSQMIRRGGLSGGESEERTDRLGTFEIRGIAAGTWMLTADAQEFARSDSLEVSVAASQVIENIEIVILAAGSISGLVTDSRGVPLSGIDVSVEPLEESSGGFNPEDWGRRLAERMMGEGDSRNVRADSQGVFRVDELAPGLYTVGFAESSGIGGHQGMFLAMAGGGATDNDTSVTAEVESGVETEVLLVKPDGARVEGRVLAGGQPVEGATVRLSTASQGGFDFRRMMGGGGERSVTDIFGRFVFEDAEVGEMELSATVPGSALPESALVETVSGTTARADIFFDGATLSGRVVDEETGAPVPNLIITIAPVRGGASAITSEVSIAIVADVGGGGPGRGFQFNSSRGGSESTVRTDQKGTFEVRYVKPGEWTVRTGPSAYVSATSDPVTVTEGSTPQEVVMEVARGAVLEGKVFEGITGNSMSGMMVRLQGDAGRARMESTDGIGGYRFEGLDGGAYTLSVMGSGWGSGALAQEEVMLELGEIKNLDVATAEEPIEEESGSSFGFSFGR